MLEVELDIFSGMPNPTWVLSRRQEATLYELLSAEPNQISPVTTSAQAIRSRLSRPDRPTDQVRRRRVGQGHVGQARAIPERIPHRA